MYMIELMSLPVLLDCLLMIITLTDDLHALECNLEEILQSHYSWSNQWMVTFSPQKGT